MPALTPSTQLHLYCDAQSLNGPAALVTSNAEVNRRFWAMAARTQLILGRLVGHADRSRPSLRMRFRCVRTASRSSLVRSRCDCSKPSLPANDRATSRACSCMDVARDLARWFFWTALGFERTHTFLVELARTIQKRLAFVHGAAGPEPLSARAVVERR